MSVHISIGLNKVRKFEVQTFWQASSGWFGFGHYAAILFQLHKYVLFSFGKSKDIQKVFVPLFLQQHKNKTKS